MKMMGQLGRDGCASEDEEEESEQVFRVNDSGVKISKSRNQQSKDKIYGGSKRSGSMTGLSNKQIRKVL